VVALLVTLAEALTADVDNLVLPLYAAAGVLSAQLVFELLAVSLH
jgi:hypothetical protein